MIQGLRTLVGGFLMGTADLIPGVSGGTIALVLGIYERLLDSIREGSSALASLIKADFTRVGHHLRRVEWSFLIPLLAGIFLAVLSLSRFIDHQLEARPTVLAGVFFGLVAGSVLVAWRLLKDPRPIHGLVGLVVAVVLFILLGLGEETVVTDPSLLVVFGSGALAICAMILPGISGSLILLLIGMYAAILQAVNDRDLLAVGVFLLGATAGLAVFSQILHWALRRHHDLILGGLIGLMAGSLRVVWPWPGGVESSTLGAPGDDWLLVLVVALMGFGSVFLIARLEAKEPVDLSEQLPAG